MLNHFNNFEHADILSNLGENCLISFRDSNKKRMYGTRNNKKRLMICSILLQIIKISKYLHDISTSCFLYTFRERQEKVGWCKRYFFIIHLYTIFSSGTQTSFLPSNNFRQPWKKRKAVKKENLIPLETNLANLKLGMERIIKTWPSELQSNKGNHCLVWRY